MLKKFKNISLKGKLVGIVAGSCILLSVALSTISMLDIKGILIEGTTRSVEEAAKKISSNVMTELESIKVSLKSVAQLDELEEIFEAFDQGFKALPQENQIPLETILRDLEKEYTTNYLNKVSYDLPGVSPRRTTSTYFPKNQSGLIAQYLYISQNPKPIDQRLNYISIPDNTSLYNQAHSKYHNTFLETLNLYKLYDVFLFNLDGDIIYSTYKEKDFATNFLHGPYANTQLGEMYRKALTLNEGEVCISDLDKYEPSYNLLGSFCATPLYKENKCIGVMAYQISLNELFTKHCSTTNRELFDNSGEILVFSKGLDLRTVPFNAERWQKSSEYAYYEKNKSPVTTLKASWNEENAQRGLKGQWGTAIIKDLDGVEQFSSFSPLDPHNTWACVINLPLSHIMMPVKKELLKIAIISISCLAVIIFATYRLLLTLISNPINELTSQIQKRCDLMRDGGEGLDQPIAIEDRAELGDIASYVNQFIATTLEMIRGIKRATGIVNSSTQELMSSANQGSSASSQQAAAVKEVVSTMEDTDQLAKGIAQRISSIVDNANEISSQIKSGSATVTSNLSLMEKIQTSNASSIAEVRTLNSLISNIWDIVGMINSIADQTKIIAFNAELEASSAGEAGKNFQIVATEVRRLADNTVTSTTEIRNKINAIQRTTDTLIDAVEHSTTEIESGCKSAQEIRSVFEKIQEVVISNTDQTQSISTSISQEAYAFEQILLTLKQIEEGVSLLKETTTISSKASQSLGSIVTDLSALVSKYQL
jgi:methyl-accepting chemotaxis protein